ncbi:MAG: nitroreductase family protein [Lentisphaeria bacterium]|nr:nitroreductase family protein [Lentisphaeria bacterium]
MPTIEDVQRIFPRAGSFAPRRGDGRFAIRNAAGEPLGTALCTSPLCDGLVGYAGPVPCLIGLDPDDRVSGVVLLANAESPSFLDYVVEEGLLSRWNGLPSAQAAQLRVDAVSGATATSEAISQAVRTTLRTQLEAVAVEEAQRPRRTMRSCLLAVAALLALLGYSAPRKLRRLRPVVLAVNVAVFGFLSGTMLSTCLFQSWLSASPRGRGALPLVVLTLVAFLLPLLFRGRDFYCSWICPYGSLQDLVGMAWRWPRILLPGWFAALLRQLRGLALAAAFVLLVAGVAVDLAAWEPFAAFRWFSSPTSARILACVLLLLSLAVPRLWCRHLCPTGYLLACWRSHSQERGGPVRVPFAYGAFAAVIGAAFVLAARPGYPPVDSGARGTSPPLPQQKDLAPHPAESPALTAESPPDVLTTIHRRKSVRTYTGAPVTETQLDVILRAAMAAPTAGNAQPWAFVAVTRRESLEALAQGLPYGKMLAQAGAAIVVCGVSDKALPGEAAQFWVQDCSAAAQNILLAAEGTGLGAVWIGVYPFQERIRAVRDACAIPETVTPLCVISLGHPAGSEQPKEKFDPGSIHRDAW